MSDLERNKKAIVEYYELLPRPALKAIGPTNNAPASRMMIPGGG